MTADDIKKIIAVFQTSRDEAEKMKENKLIAPFMPELEQVVKAFDSAIPVFVMLEEHAAGNRPYTCEDLLKVESKL